MWNEFGRAVRTWWAVYAWGMPLCQAVKNLDYGSTLILFSPWTGCMWWQIAPSLN